MPKIELEDLKGLAFVNANACFETLKRRGAQDDLAVWFLAETLLNTDWACLSDEYEEKGYMTFLSLTLLKNHLSIIEKDGEVCILVRSLGFRRKILLFEMDEYMMFGDDFIVKLKKELKSWVYKNARQLLVV